MAKYRNHRLKVSKSLHHVYATLIDQHSNILAESSTLLMKFKQANVKNCFEVGQDIGRKCKELNIDSISFDRNGMLYHGRIKSIADGARDVGLEF